MLIGLQPLDLLLNAVGDELLDAAVPGGCRRTLRPFEQARFDFDLDHAPLLPTRLTPPPKRNSRFQTPDSHPWFPDSSHLESGIRNHGIRNVSSRGKDIPSDHCRRS